MSAKQASLAMVAAALRDDTEGLHTLVSEYPGDLVDLAESICLWLPILLDGCHGRTDAEAVARAALGIVAANPTTPSTTTTKEHRP